MEEQRELTAQRRRNREELAISSIPTKAEIVTKQRMTKKKVGKKSKSKGNPEKSETFQGETQDTEQESVDSARTLSPFFTQTDMKQFQTFANLFLDGNLPKDFRDVIADKTNPKQSMEASRLVGMIEELPLIAKKFVAAYGSTDSPEVASSLANELQSRLVMILELSKDRRLSTLNGIIRKKFLQKMVSKLQGYINTIRLTFRRPCNVLGQYYYYGTGQTKALTKTKLKTKNQEHKAQKKGTKQIHI